MLNLHRSSERRIRRWIGLCAVVALSGCATGLFVVEGAGCGPFRMRGEKVAAVVMVNDDSIRLAGEEALARELSVRGAAGVPMYTLLAGAHPDEAKARSGRASGVVGVVVLRPVRVDKEISSRPTYSGVMVMDGGFWGGYYGHGWGSAWSAGKFVPTHHHRRRSYSLHQNKLVVGAKQDYESRKSESPDREHGQTGRRRARGKG